MIFQIHTLRGWIILGILTVIAIVLIPLLNILLPPDSFFHVPTYVIKLLGKYLCYAMVALAMDMIWGYTGILSLGHGLFFALGGYCMGMYLMRSIGKLGVYASDLPDFMVFLDWKELPWYWHGFEYFPFAMLMVILVPGVLAFLFGYLAFRARVAGVYFAIISQAMTYAAMLAFFRNDMGFGGNNGMTDFKTILGYSLQDDSTKLGLYIISGVFLLLIYLLCRYLVTSKFGRVLQAIRDAEERVRFSGYNPLYYKLFIWTFSAVICAIAGALYVPQVGIINPSEMQPSNSIEIAIWVAVGGRGSLIGAVMGSGMVNYAKTFFTVAFPDWWLYFLGALFVGVTIFLPRGIYGFFSRKQGA